MAENHNLKDTSEIEKSSNLWWIVGGVFAVFVIGVWIANFYYLPEVITDSNERGIFGDSFGAINSLFSGLAFVGVIVAILLQKEELEQQRKVLKATRDEFEEQNKTLKQQRFENTFFNMVTLHNEIVSAIQGNQIKNGNITKGRDALDEIFRFLKNSWNNNIEKNLDVKTNSLTSDTFDKHYSHVIGHYFRNLYRIFVFIENNKDIIDSKFYSKILRAQLSDSEILLLFYNTHYYNRGNNFQKYTKKYQLFDNIREENFIHEEHRKLFNSFYKKK